MAKIATPTKQKGSRKKRATARVALGSSDLKNSKLVSDTLIECIRTGDLDAFRDVLASHITITNKLQLSKRTGIGRRTLYDILDPTLTSSPSYVPVGH
jgi:hypothetical protein